MVEKKPKVLINIPGNQKEGFRIKMNFSTKSINIWGILGRYLDHLNLKTFAKLFFSIKLNPCLSSPFRAVDDNIFNSVY